MEGGKWQQCNKTCARKYRGGARNCMKEKLDERKENDEHQRKTDSRREVSDWLLLISEAFI